MAKTHEDPDLKQHLAADLIRQKIDTLYKNEPAVKVELAHIKSMHPHSKHQQFMLDLTQSGRGLAEIQTAWHSYYSDLPDEEKHQVWQEFYNLHGKGTKGHTTTKDTDAQKITTKPKGVISSAPKTMHELKQRVLKSVTAQGRLKPKHHIKSLVFGLSMGGLSMLILLFGFFNERFIAPFISPSKNVSSSPVIIDPSATTVASADPKIIIPKINVEVPVVYDAPSVEEKAVQKALEGGVVHYVDSPRPGEQGNAVIVGHSSNNILNKGKYKFAFVLLNRMEIGDTFYINKDGKRFVYKIFDKKVVSPTDFSVLGDTQKISSVTLITCDPPGTSVNRLIVVGEQILPDPNANLASSVQPTSERPEVIPGNAPSLWQRIKDWIFS